MMTSLGNVLLTRTFRRLLKGIVWVFCFVAVFGLISAYALYKTSEVISAETRPATDHFIRIRTHLGEGFAAMRTRLSGAPCSHEFIEQMRRIAYRPDGYNEFLYVPGGVVQCTSAAVALAAPVDLGEPDIRSEDGRDLSYWVDRKLDFLGIPGAIGSVVASGPFGAVIPPQEITLNWSDWLEAEVALVAPDGTFSHRLGVPGIYEQAIEHGDGLRLTEGKIFQTMCDQFGLHCFSIRADIVKLAAREKVLLGLMVAAAILLASWATTLISRLASKYWSFEARFRRNLDAASIICTYQPILNLRTGEIAGCEVLARWRDVDGSVVMPYKFIPLVERDGIGLRFTELLAERAFDELSTHVPANRPMRVSFNIFPSILNSQDLAQVFSNFLSVPDRFDLAVEIIESDEMPANAQQEIESLRHVGIKTYIDDFGTGYSNMQNLAALSVDGVKLDRAFAMAPDNSMMAQMLRHAIEMIASTGHSIVVEGVETAERLELLRGLPHPIDYVQGYYISRPLDIHGFTAFLANWGKVSTDMPAIPQARFAV